ncbi:MAG: hypothetical protein KDF65_12025 [Anaerolineae bacterium]|nr:hypothetical protein [Anaerolineae bacterium]
MNQPNRLEIITQHGWAREYPLTKGIIHIGSAPTNDIRLDERFGGGVAPLHVQLITISNGSPVYKLINLGETNLVVGADEELLLAPQAVLDLTDGLQFKVGEFTLIFHSGGPTESGSIQLSRSIGLTLELPHTQLAPHQALEGVVVVSNLGHQMGARFDLTLEGLEPDCYELAPGPLLSSGAEKEVFFCLYHRGHKPLAGSYQLVIRATAPETYPGEQATASQLIEVLPHYQHGLSLAPAKGITAQRPALNQARPAPAPAPEADAAWDLPVEPKPLAARTFTAGSPPAKNGVHPASDSAEAVGQDWAVAPEFPAAITAGPEVAAQPETEGATPTQPPAAPAIEWDADIEAEFVSYLKPAQTVKLSVLPQKSGAGSPVVMKEEAEKWWDTP